MADTTGIGARLKHVRAGVIPAMTQHDMARALGVSVSTYRNYEQGRIIPGRTVVKLLAILFNVSADWLLTGDAREIGNE